MPTMPKTALLPLALLLALPAASALDWVTPEGSPMANGVVGSDGDGDPSPLWRRTLPGDIEALAPAGDLLLASSGQVLHALDARTGEPTWTHDAGERNVTSVVVAANVVYAVEASGTRQHAPRAERVLALDLATGDERWSTNAQAEFVGALTFSEGRVLMGSTTGILALDADDGSIAWTVPLNANKPIAPMPGLVGALVPEAVVALRAADGSEAWRIERPGCILNVADRIAYQDGTIYVGGRGEGECIDAWDVATQQRRWALKTPFPRGFDAESPMPQGGRVHLRAGTEAFAYDAATGREIWRNAQLGSGGLTDMLVGPTRVFAAHLGGHISILDAATGENITRFRADGTDGPVSAATPGIRDPFVVAEGILYATQHRDDNTLHALDLGGTRTTQPPATTSDETGEGGFPWWILIVALVAIAVVAGVALSRRKKDA